MQDTLLPQLEDPEARKAVAEAVLALFNRWNLHEVNQARLLGIPTVIELKRKIVDADTDTMERIGYLLAIDRALLKHYPLESRERDRWIFTANEHLHGLTPLSVMLEKGIAGLVVVKALIVSGG